MLREWTGKRRVTALQTGALGLALLGLLSFGGGVRGAAPGTWTAVPAPIPHPLARSGHTLATYNGAGILFGGQSPNPSGPGSIALSDLWVYRPSGSGFDRLNSTTPLPPARYGHASAVQTIRMYTFFGRRGDGTFLSDVWYYDFPRVCWEPYPSAGTQPPSRAEHSAVTVDADFILLLGGRAADGTTLLDDLWRYETFTRKWVQRASIPGGGRCGHVAAFLGGRMFALGGTTAAGPQNDVWAFDPKTNAWSQLASDGDVPGPFTGSSGAVGDFERSGSQQIMVAGGRDAGGYDITEAYLVSIDPNGQTAHWKLQAPHTGGFQAAAAAVVPPNGPASADNLLLFGGLQAGTPSDKGWLFSRAGGTGTGPDLAPIWGKVTAKAQGKGKSRRWKLTGRLQVSNKGSAKAGASTLRLLLSADASADSADRALKQVKVRALSAGKAAASSWTVTLPRGQSVSGLFVVAVADAAGKVTESNETNNTAPFGPIP